MTNKTLNLKEDNEQIASSIREMQNSDEYKLIKDRVEGFRRESCNAMIVEKWDEIVSDFNSAESAPKTTDLAQVINGFYQKACQNFQELKEELAKINELEEELRKKRFLICVGFGVASSATTFALSSFGPLAPVIHEGMNAISTALGNSPLGPVLAAVVVGVTTTIMLAVALEYIHNKLEARDQNKNEKAAASVQR